MSDRFLGAWLVTEYVFAADEAYVGAVRQRRELVQLAGGRIRVRQVCEVSAEFPSHPMAGFAGEWVFDLSIDGQLRRYHGPDVIGSGMQWADGVMTGRGRWPRFGHDFVSYGLLGAAGAQITGGVFHDDGVPVAQIVGVARAVADDSVEFPTLPIAADYATTTHHTWVSLLAAEQQPDCIPQLIAGMLLYSALCAPVFGRTFTAADARHAAVRLVRDAGCAPESADAALATCHRWRTAPWD